MIRTVSVVIPCYRQAHFLPECIASLQAQTHADWEAIIVNDGSPDNTRDVALELMESDTRIRYVEQSNGGLSAARNAGMAAAKGDAFQFLDADDLLQSHKLQRQVAALNVDSSLGVVYGSARYFHGSDTSRLAYNLLPGTADEDWIQARWSAWLSRPPGFVRHNLFPVCSALVRRSIVEAVGAFDPTLPALEDWDYWWRCERASAQFSFVPDEGSHALIRVHGASMTHESERMKLAYFMLRRKHMPDLPAGSLRDHNLDELLRVGVDLQAMSKQQALQPVLDDMPATRDRLQARLYFALHRPWYGQAFTRAACRSIPWRIRVRLGALTGLRALCSV